MPKLRVLALLAALGIVPVACGPAGPSRAAVTQSIQARVVSVDQTGKVSGERLLEPKAVARFYKARNSKTAWNPDVVPKIVEAIQGVYADGLNPEDYHLATIQRLDERRKHATTAELEADLDLLVSDAIAALVDHSRYGRIHPRSLDPRWNVDPRDGAPPLEESLTRVLEAGDPVKAVQAEKPDHFIYKGLVGALAQLRAIETNGGWGTVPAGKAIRPGTLDPRVPRLRTRLAASGELDAAAKADSSRRYDAALVAAVKLFQARHRLDETGVVDKTTLAAMNVTASARAAQVRVNLERARWVLGGLKGDFMLVNLPAFKAYLIQGNQNVWEARTQIGEEAKQTPTFRATMHTVVFNPDWTVPQSIVAEEILPKVERDKGALEKLKLKVYDSSGGEVDPSSVDWSSASEDNFPYTLKQPPGPDNPLGRVKFLFPNKYSIYLHDTPSKHLFETSKRTLSHGCIRLENALDLAELLLRGQDGWDQAKIQEVLATTETQNVELAHGPAVLIVYWTVSVGASGEVRYADDIYHLDQALLDALNAPSRAVTTGPS